MKCRIFSFVFLLFFGGAKTSHAEGFWRALGASVVAGLPHVSSPLLQQQGITVHGHNMVITNNSRFFCKIIVYGKEVAQLGPGDSGYDDRHFEPLSPQLPAVALCYHNPEMTEYVGATGQIFQLSSGYPTSFSWTISEGEVRGPDGNQAPTDVVPEHKPEEKKATFPREWWNATSGVQVVNNTPYSMTVRINGQNLRINGQNRAVATSELYYLSAKEIYGFVGRELTIQLVFTDENHLVGTYTYSVYVPTRGVYAYQLIVGPHDIQRQY